MYRRARLVLRCMLTMAMLIVLWAAVDVNYGEKLSHKFGASLVLNKLGNPIQWLQSTSLPWWLKRRLLGRKEALCG